MQSAESRNFGMLPRDPEGSTLIEERGHNADAPVLLSHSWATDPIPVGRFVFDDVQRFELADIGFGSAGFRFGMQGCSFEQ